MTCAELHLIINERMCAACSNVIVSLCQLRPHIKSALAMIEGRGTKGYLATQRFLPRAVKAHDNKPRRAFKGEALGPGKTTSIHKVDEIAHAIHASN